MSELVPGMYANLYLPIFPSLILLIVQRMEPSTESEKPKGKVLDISIGVAILIVPARSHESEACQKVL